MRHQCRKCGMYKLATNMKRIPSHRGLPKYECHNCHDIMCQHWRHSTRYKPPKYQYGASF